MEHSSVTKKKRKRFSGALKGYDLPMVKELTSVRSMTGTQIFQAPSLKLLTTPTYLFCTRIISENHKLPGGILFVHLQMSSSLDCPCHRQNLASKQIELEGWGSPCTHHTDTLGISLTTRLYHGFLIWCL